MASPSVEGRGNLVGGAPLNVIVSPSLEGRGNPGGGGFFGIAVRLPSSEIASSLPLRFAQGFGSPSQ